MVKKFTIPMTCQITCYGRVTVEAENLDDAIEIIENGINDEGFGCHGWQDGTWDPEWQSAEQLQVDHPVLDIETEGN